jgi:hypothetical protein
VGFAPTEKNDTVIAERRAELTAYVTAYQEGIACGERIILFVDECFLLWGDACGYVWGKRTERVTVPVGNVRASHHKAAAVQAYLAEVNAGLPEEDWTITCRWFAPHDPSQNRTR